MYCDLTAIGLYDIQTVPVQTEYPGAGILATATSNIMDRNFLRLVPVWVNWMIICILSLIPFFISGQKPLKELLYLAVVGTVFAGIVIIFFHYNW